MSTDPSTKPETPEPVNIAQKKGGPPTNPAVLEASSAALMRGVIALLLGIGVLVWGLTGHAGPFIQGPLYMVILGSFVGIYGLAVMIVVFGTRSRLRLNRSELAAWGPALESRRAWLLEQLRDGARPGELADQLESEDGLPRHISLRYIIAIGRAALSD